MERLSGAGERINYPRYQSLTYEDFRQLAADPTLSDSERIGAPDLLRAGMEPQILNSIVRCLELDRSGLSVIDIGCGCGRLAFETIAYCRGRMHHLVLADSPEVLELLPEDTSIQKVAGRFPSSLAGHDEYFNRFDAIIAYSVLHYVFREASVFDFVDSCLELLAPGGALLLGDLPNTSMRKRFFLSDQGRTFHHRFMNTSSDPEVTFNTVERYRMDDSVILALLARARTSGYDAFVQPQPHGLPYANRREDIIVRRP